jgi:hypothetical protein
LALVLYALLAASMVIGLGLVLLGANAFIKGSHPHQTASTSVKIPGVAEITTGGPLGLLVLGIALFATGSLLWDKVPPDIPAASQSIPSSPSDPQSLEAKELEELASYISEDPLSKMQETLAYNITIQNLRTQFLASNPTAQFPYQQACPNCRTIISVRTGNWNGSHINPGQTLDKNGIGLTEAPNEVAYLVIPPDQPGIPDPSTFLSSPYLPSVVKALFEDYVNVVGKNQAIMTGILDGYRHKGVKYFQEARDPASPYYNVVVNDFAGKIISSTAERQKVLSAIQSSLKTQ